MTIKSNSTTVFRILDPLKRTGGKIINNINAVQQITQDYPGIVDTYVGEVTKNLTSLDASVLRQVKISLFKQGVDKYKELIEAAGNVNAVAKQVYAIVDSEEDFTQVEAKPEFGNYQVQYAPHYQTLVNNVEKMKENFKPLAEHRFIPSFTPQHFRNAASSIMSDLKDVVTKDGAINEENVVLKELRGLGVLSELSQAQTELLIDIIGRMHESINDAMLEGGLAIDLLDFVGRLDTKEVSAHNRVNYTADFAMAAVNSSLLIAPGFVSELEDDMAKMQEGDFLAVTVSDKGWVEHMLHRDTEDAVEVVAVPSLRNILLAVASAWVTDGISMQHIALPIQASPYFPMLHNIFARSYADMTLEFNLTFLDKLRDIVSKGEGGRPRAYSAFAETLDSAIANDELLITTKAREIVEKHVFGDVSATITRHLSKVGTKENVVQRLDGDTKFTLTNNYEDKRTEVMNFSADRQIFPVAGIPVATPEFSAEALVIKGVGQRSAVISSVAGDQVKTVVQNLYNWDGQAKDKFVISHGLHHIMDNIRRDAESERSKTTLQTGATAVVDYSQLPSYSSMTLAEVCAMYSAPVPKGHTQVWREVHSQEHVVSIGHTNQALMKSLMHVATRTDSAIIGQYSGALVQPTAKMASQVLGDLIFRLTKAYFNYQFPKVVDNIEYRRTFKNVPYHKRTTDFDDHFVEVDLDPSVIRLINHRLAAPYVIGAIDPLVLDRVVREKVFVLRNVEKDVDAYAERLVSSITATMDKKSDTMVTLTKFLDGKLTAKDQDDMKKSDVIGFFDILLNTIFDSISGASTELVLLYTSCITKHLMGKSKKGRKS